MASLANLRPPNQPSFIINYEELWLAGDPRPLAVLRSGINSEGFFILDEYRPDDTGIIGAAQVQDCIRNDANFFVRVNKRENRLGKSHIRQISISSFCRILDRIGQKLNRSG